MGSIEERSYDRGAAVIAIADTPAGTARIARAVHAIGGRLLAELAVEEAGERLRGQAAADVAVLDCEADAGDRLDDLLQILDSAAEQGLYRAVVAVPLELVDVVHAKLGHRDIAIICPSRESDLIAAVGLAAARPELVLQEGREDGELARLGEEVGRIAEALVRLSSSEARSEELSIRESPFAYRAEPNSADDSLGADEVRRLIRHRRMRDRFFDGGLFADPAWDILLDLMAARIEDRPVSVSSLCIAAAVPATTALRWIRTMTERGLLLRDADPLDGRRVFIRLGEEAAQALSAWFAATRQDAD